MEKFRKRRFISGTRITCKLGDCTNLTGHISEICTECREGKEFRVRNTKEGDCLLVPSERKLKPKDRKFGRLA